MRRRNGVEEALDAGLKMFALGRQGISARNEREAGDAYKAGSEVTGLEDVDTVGQYNQAAVGLRNNAEEFASLTPEEREAAAAAYDKATVTGSQYHVGRGDGQEGQAYDHAPTRQERASGGLRRQGDYFYGRGDQARGDRALDQVDQMQEREANSAWRTEQQGRQRLTWQDEDRVREAKANFEKTIKDPTKYVLDKYNRDQIGGPEHAGFTMDYRETPDGVLAWRKDKDGKADYANAKHYTREQIQNLAFRDYMASAGDAVGLARHDMDARKQADTASYQDRMAGVAEQNAKTNEAYRRQLGAAAGGGSKAGQPLGVVGTNFIYPDGSSKPILVNGKPPSAEELSFFKKQYGEGSVTQQMVKVKLTKPDGTGESEVQMPMAQAITEGHMPPPAAYQRASAEAQKVGIRAELSPDMTIGYHDGDEWVDSLEEAVRNRDARKSGARLRREDPPRPANYSPIVNPAVGEFFSGLSPRRIADRMYGDADRQRQEEMAQIRGLR